MPQIWNLCRYIPDVSRAIYDVLEIMSAPIAQRPRYGPEYQDLLEKVAKREVTEATLKQKLTSHVQQVHICSDVCLLTSFISEVEILCLWISLLQSQLLFMER